MHRSVLFLWYFQNMPIKVFILAIFAPLFCIVWCPAFLFLFLSITLPNTPYHHLTQHPPQHQSIWTAHRTESTTQQTVPVSPETQVSGDIRTQSMDLIQVSSTFQVFTYILLLELEGHHSSVISPDWISDFFLCAYQENSIAKDSSLVYSPRHRVWTYCVCTLSLTM